MRVTGKNQMCWMNGVSEVEFDDLVKQRAVFIERKFIDALNEVAAGMGISPERFLMAFAKKLYRDVMNFYGVGLDGKIEDE